MKIENPNDFGRRPIEEAQISSVYQPQNFASSQISSFGTNILGGLLGTGGMGMSPMGAGGFSPFGFSMMPMLMEILSKFFSSGMMGGIGSFDGTFGLPQTPPTIAPLYGAVNPQGEPEPPIGAKYGIVNPKPQTEPERPMVSLYGVIHPKPGGGASQDPGSLRTCYFAGPAGGNQVAVGNYNQIKERNLLAQEMSARDELRNV